MFTGIVERRAAIEEIAPGPGGVRLVISGQADRCSAGDPGVWGGLQVGESISVDGCCLTLISADDRLHFDVVEETLRRTSLGRREVGSLVNLERALRVGDRLGGHYVTGHIDSQGRIASIQEDGEVLWHIEHEVDDSFRTVEKGSVTVDGVSLTVVSSSPGAFSVALIPHTLEVTSLGVRAEGDPLNLEMDHFGRWVSELLKDRQGGA